MGVHQWYVQAGHSQLWLTPHFLVDRGSHMEGHMDDGKGKDKIRMEKQSSLFCFQRLPIWQTYSYRILSVHQWTSSWWILRPLQLVEMVACWVSQPIGGPCLPMHYWSAWSWESIITTSTLKATTKEEMLTKAINSSLLCCPVPTLY